MEEDDDDFYGGAGAQVQDYAPNDFDDDGVDQKMEVTKQEDDDDEDEDSEDVRTTHPYGKNIY
jgi:hypothetical protein